jgi:hypothetical protein
MFPQPLYQIACYPDIERTISLTSKDVGERLSFLHDKGIKQKPCPFDPCWLDSRLRGNDESTL